MTCGTHASMLTILRHVVMAFTLTVCAASSGIAIAETFPSKTVTIVVPFPPGGSPDQLARVLAQQLGVLWKQAVIVENRPGAGGNIAAASVARARPDGYTLLMGTDGPLAINVSLYEKLPFDVQRDFAPIGLVATVDFALVASPGLAVANLKELIDYARKQQPPLAYGSAGIGSQHHLGMEMFRHQARVEMRHVPYKGVAQALADVMGNHVDVMFAAMPAAAPLIRTGKVRALAVTGARRSQMAPDVPTFAEAGFGTFSLQAWFGLLAPAGASASVVNQINRDVTSVLAMPDVRATLATNGFDVTTGSPSQFADFIRTEGRRWSAVTKASGARAD